MPFLRRKVLAYIMHGQRLLVFCHPHAPEAGIQVPAGTVKDGERPEDAVMREAVEETGLTELRLISFLGEEVRDMSSWGVEQVHHRYFYHLECGGSPPRTWRHWEGDPSDGTAGPIEFEFWWADLADGVLELSGDHGALVPELLKRLCIGE